MQTARAVVQAPYRHNNVNASSLQQMALAYARKGRPVFPCNPSTKQPLTAKGFKDATTDQATITAWWQKNPHAAIAIPTGHVSGIFVLDVDMPKPGKPEDGRESLVALESKYGALPETLVAKTQSGGRHHYFKMPTGINLRNSSNKLSPKLDIRAEGGYVLLPGSVGYEWISRVEMADAPGWLINLCLAHSAPLERIPQEHIGKGRPGDDFNARGDIRPFLEDAGWTFDRHAGPGERWTRPGKGKGTSATIFEDGSLYCFSGNAEPFEADKRYTPFAVYTLLQHDGDWEAAAKKLAFDGYGDGLKGRKGLTPLQHGESVRAKRGLTRAKIGEKEIAALQSKAQEKLGMKVISTTPYPVEALGPLAPVCKTLSSEGQVPLEMAGQCLLTTAALLTQSRANVQTLGGVKPLSLYALTVAESGEGKSTADDAAQHEVTDWQRKEAKKYKEDVQRYEAEKACRKRNEPLPQAPLEPYRIMRDGTVEGIRRSFRQGAPSQGVFSSEAAVMLAGYGMSPDHRAKSAGNFNSLWDCGEISVARGLDGRLQLYDRRLSLHWLVQPEVASTAIHDSLLSSIGFWPRFLLACPPPSKPLLAKRFDPNQQPDITQFWNACSEMLNEPLGEDCSKLPVITPTAEAENLACRFYELMQTAAKSEGGELVDVKPFAVRATEQAFRVAGVLSVFAGHSSIDADLMRNGISLAGYSLETWRSVFGDRHEQAAKTWALSLHSWLIRQPEQKASSKAMLQIGPKRIRSKDRRDTAIAVLQQAGLIFNDGNIWYAEVEV